MVKYVKKNLNMTKPRYTEQILPVPWPTVKYSSRDVTPWFSRTRTPWQHHRICVYIWQANQKQRSLLDPYNSVMIGSRDVTPWFSRTRTPWQHHRICVYIWQANQKQRSLLDPFNSVMIGYPDEWSSAMPCHKSLLLSIKSVNIEVSAVWCLTIIGKWKLSTRLIHFLHYRVEDSF